MLKSVKIQTWTRVLNTKSRKQLIHRWKTLDLANFLSKLLMLSSKILCKALLLSAVENTSKSNAVKHLKCLNNINIVIVSHTSHTKKSSKSTQTWIRHTIIKHTRWSNENRQMGTQDQESWTTPCGKHPYIKILINNIYTYIYLYTSLVFSFSLRKIPFWIGKTFLIKNP